MDAPIGLDKIALIVGAVILVGLLFLIFSSSAGIFFVIICIIGIIFFIVLAKGERDRFNPSKRLSKKMEESCALQGSGKMNQLVLSGSYRQQESKRGRILGTSAWIEDSKDPEGNDVLPTDDPRKKLFVFLYTPSKPFWFWKIPPFSFFRRKILFGCYEDQLLTKEFTIGDIYVKGTSTTFVGFMEMINDLQLDTGFEMQKLKSGVYRETLELHFEQLPTLIDQAVKSDPNFIKVGQLKDDQGGSAT